MTNKFKIGDIVREIRSVAKLDANGNYVFRKNGAAVETKAWSDYTLEIVAVPDGKKKRYAVLRTFDSGETNTSHYGEKVLALASTVSPTEVCKTTASGVKYIG